MCKRAFEYRSETPSDANAGTPHDIGGLEAINKYWFAPNVCNIHIKKILVDNNNNKAATISGSDARYPRGDEPQRKPAASNALRAKRTFAQQEQEHEQEQQQHKRQHYHQGHSFVQRRFSHAARRGSSSSSSSSSSSKW